MKNLFCIALLLVIFTSCTNFKGPQPAGAPDLNEFPQEMQGTYLNDDSKLVISHDKIEFWVDKNKASMHSFISDSLTVRSMSPWVIGTRKSQFPSGGDNYSVFALKLDEQNPNILHGIQTEEEDILKLLPNIRRSVEQHSTSTSDGVPDPPKDVIIFDPTPQDFRQIIEAAFAKKRGEAGYKGFERQ
ncbi:MAG: hypothetical protein IPM82_22370 [Saprospiraceae bacterium]|nr:hypothetical protein [Saprospiraceae bacterium]